MFAAWLVCLKFSHWQHCLEVLHVERSLQQVCFKQATTHFSGTMHRPAVQHYAAMLA
jgi:hypothetical protein